MNENHFLKTDLILASGNSFLASGNHFLPLPQIFFKKFFIQANENIFFSPAEKVLFFTENFSPASVNHYSYYREAYLKLLSLLLAMIFFEFSDICANVSSFFVSILASGNRFSVYLKHILLSGHFFLLVEMQYLKNNLIPASGI